MQRDIEATLGANANKIYAMCLRHAVHHLALPRHNHPGTLMAQRQ